MTEEIVELKEKNFDNLTKKEDWVIYFWAEWCGPCKMMALHFEAAAKEAKGHIQFGKINVEDNYNLAERFNVMSIPTCLFSRNGEVLHATVGALNKEQILNLIQDNFI